MASINQAAEGGSINNNSDEEFIEAALLDTLEDCVNCVEGVESQHQYETKIDTQLKNIIATAAHGLTKYETLLIRSKLLDEQRILTLTSNDSNKLESDHFNTVIDICGLEDLPTVICHCMGCESDSRDNDQKHKKLNPAAKESSPYLKDLISPKQKHCAICFDVDGNKNTPENVTFASLPCCGSHGREESSSIKICTVCILLLTLPNSDGSGRIGRCPRCRSWINVKSNAVNNKGPKKKKKSVAPVNDTVTISKVDLAGQCKICCQQKEHLVDNNDGTICDACFIGRTNPLLYECEKCHKTQKIPFPLYRYQSYMDQFGRKAWHCHSGDCSNPQFTNWRILPDQLNLISPGDEPVEWSVDYMAIAKERVLEAKNEFSVVLFNGRKDSKKNNCFSDHCFIC